MRAAGGAMVVLASAVAAAAPGPARPAPPTPPASTPFAAGATVALSAAHVTLALPAVTGWTLASVGGTDVLAGGDARIAVARGAEPCAAWARAAEARPAPAWAPGTIWPSARPDDEGVTVCVQGAELAYTIAVAYRGTGAPPADALAVLGAVADGIRPPVALLPGLPPLRLPMPVTPRGDHAWTGVDGDETFPFELATRAGSCALAVVAREGDLVDDAAPAPWAPTRVEREAQSIACAELADRGMRLTWPQAHPALRAAVMRGLAAAARDAWGPAVTNARGAVTLGGRSVPLALATAGGWKAQERDGATLLTSLDADVPFELALRPGAPCPDGDRMLLERTQGFAPAALQPLRRLAVATPPATLVIGACVGGAVVEIRALSDAAEPPSGPAAVKVRAALVAAVSALGLDPEGFASGAAPRPAVREPAATSARYRSDVGVWGGLLSLSPVGAGGDRGALVGADVRASPKYGFGLAANLAGEIGYTSGVQGEVRGGVGGGLGLGVISIQGTAGAAAGGVGAAGTADLYVQGSALLELRYAIATAAVLRTVAIRGADQTRYDVRLAIAPGAERGTIVAGLQLIQLAGAGSAFVAYIGMGFTSAHEATAPE